jgi:hypothetical protein
MKNPDSKPLRIKWTASTCPLGNDQVASVLATLAVAESNLVRAGKDSALPHFITLVKAIEEIYGFTFEKLEESNE